MPPSDWTVVPEKAAPQAGWTPVVQTAAPAASSDGALSTVADVAIGALKGAGRTAVNLGQLVQDIPGVTKAVDALYGTPGLSQTAFGEAKKALASKNTAQSVGGLAETAAELAIPVGETAQLAGDVLPSAARAGRGFQDVMSATKNVPIDVEAPGQVALRIQQLADRGASMPQAVRKFLVRVTDPDKGAMTYEEARDFASNISRLSANEAQRLTPVVAREVSNLRVALNGSAAKAAATAGKLEEYQGAMSEYANAMKVKDAVDAAWTSAKKALPVIGGAGAAYWLTKHVSDLLTGGE